MSKNNDESANQKTTKSFSNSFSSLENKPENDFDLVLARLKAVFGVETDTDLAKKLDLKQGSISTAKQKKSVPPTWITAVALKHGISADWLLTGEGKMRRGVSVEIPTGQGKTLAGVAAATTIMAERRDASDASLLDPAKQNPNIADLVAKTIEVLQSKTVFQTALESNIEAFHHAIILERKIDQVEDRIMENVSKRFDELEKITRQLGDANADLRAENEKLRQELEHNRAQSAVRDTG